MGSNSQKTKTEKSFRRTLLLPTLFLCIFLLWSIPWFFSTLLVNLSSTFNISIGTLGQISTLFTLVGLIIGFAISAIALKFKHKSILLVGVAIYVVGSFAYAFAQNILAVVLLELFLGAGAVTIASMVYTLIGEQLPLEKRGWAVGLMITSVMVSAIIVDFAAGAIANVAGWRAVPLWLIFPLSIVCLALSLVVLPSKQPQLQTGTKPSFTQALKRIFLHRSPIACALSTLLIAFIATIPLYAVAFYRVVYSVSPATGGAFASLAALGGAIGGLVGGRFVNRVGRRRIAIIGAFISGVTCILFSFIPIVALSVFIWAIAAGSVGVAWAGLPALSLEQVPEYKASMMSVNTAFDNAGGILGVFIGGLVLNLLGNFHLVFTISGAVGALTAAVLLFFAKDPCKTISAQ